MNYKIKVRIPDDWSFEHIPIWEYDEDGDLEVSNFMCRTCEYFGGKCKCINHNYVHFHRPWFSCDVMRENHTICKQFKPLWDLSPAGCLEWEALGGFDEWYRIWRKQWHYNKDQPWTKVPLIRAVKELDEEHDRAKDREFCDDVYYVPYEDFLNCDIMQKDGIHCLDFQHIEIDRKSPLGYSWVSEGPGLWIPWEKNRYIKYEGR